MTSTTAPLGNGSPQYPDPITLSVPRPARLSNKQVGQLGEDMAAQYVSALNYRILARNWRDQGPTRGELDLVCQDHQSLIVIEVKTRRSGSYGHPSLAVNDQKVRQLHRLTAAYLRELGHRPGEIRFDVIAILLGRFDEVSRPKSGQIMVVAQEFDHLVAVA